MRKSSIMSIYRQPPAHDQLVAAYQGLPSSDPKLPMSKAIGSIHAAIYDLQEGDRPELRLGANEIDIRWRLAEKHQGQPLPSDFQAAIDQLAQDGQVFALVGSRGTVYSLTPTGRLAEEALRVPRWRRLLNKIPALLRYVLGAFALAFIGLAASLIWHSFLR
jgi:hypothetical protein